MRPNLAAGSLDLKITVQRLADGAANAFGEPAEEWSEMAVLWASYHPVSDGEIWRAGRVEYRARARFQVRWSSLTAQITERDRVRADPHGDNANRLWSIVGLKVMGRRELVEITAEAVT